MRKAIVVACLVVFAAVLVEASTAGHRVAGSAHPAAVTAGINLGTGPSEADLSDVDDPDLPVVGWLLTLLALTAVAAMATAVADLPTELRSVLRTRGSARRGPPALT